MHDGANEAATRRSQDRHPSAVQAAPSAGAQAALTAGRSRRSFLAPPVAFPPGIPDLTWLFTCRFSAVPVADDTVHPGLPPGHPGLPPGAASALVRCPVFTGAGHTLHHNAIDCRYFLILEQVTGAMITRLDLVSGVGSTGEERT